MSEWKLRARCRGHKDPELWFPIGQADLALDAKAVCIQCPVRRECGEHAIDSGETHAVMGGYRCSTPKERMALRAFIGRDRMITRACTSCGAEFETRQRMRRCPECRGLVEIEPCQERIHALRAAGMTNAVISARSGVTEGTIAKLSTGHPQFEWRHCSRLTAESILAIEIPAEVWT